MVKRILGFLFSVAVVAVIVFAVLRRDRFVSYIDCNRPAQRDSVAVQTDTVIQNSEFKIQNSKFKIQPTPEA